MVVKQTNLQVVRFSFLNAFFITFGLALGSTISGFFHEDFLKIFSIEYAVLFLICFCIAFFTSWVTTSKDFQVEINEQGLKLSDQNLEDTFTWDEIESMKQPSLFMSRWVFVLKQGRKVKLVVNKFSRQQDTELAAEINKYYS